MEQEALVAQKRTTSGSRPARRMRRDGRVPAVVYGSDLETTSISVDSRELGATLHTEAGLNALINVVVDGEDEVLTVAREIQRDPVRRVGLLEVVDLAGEPAGFEIRLEFFGVEPIGRAGEAVALARGGFDRVAQIAQFLDVLPDLCAADAFRDREGFPRTAPAAGAAKSL